MTPIVRASTMGSMTDVTPSVPVSGVIRAVTARREEPVIVIGADDEDDERRVIAAFREAREAGTLGVTADPRCTGPDGHVHVAQDHDPGSRQHHASGEPHHHGGH